MYISSLCLLCFVSRSQSIEFSSIEDIKALSELPLEKLLSVKHSFEVNDENITNLEDWPESRIDFPGPVALRLKDPSRGGYEHEHYEYDEHEYKKGGKEVKNFFQLAVTALAFLAFGGYLLCLIVQAIKSKQMDQITQMANMQMMAAILKKQIANRKRTARPRRTKPTRNRKNEVKKRPRREAGVWPGTDPENMYFALVSLSEAYANQHTIDYRDYNRTSKIFS